ncbi:TIR domain-containing protein [Qipengyuania aquimaris]|uniref:TIR domain-containing protein n=1 Tax=Qipengyuania aquimaris TaxID=255984 RepID=UPI001C94E3C4|nr:TIR domain-containing protein [Qipengyuania aquimaris]MBY6128034.1 TIR domain-containing protein [Qipengyuania aquimaris]
MTDVFVSYARSNYDAARRVADVLCDDGYSVWIDDDLPAHRAFSTVIEEHLTEAKAVLVLWSADAKRSRWVPAEADLAYNADKLVQMSLDGELPPLPFNRVHCEMAKGWNGEHEPPCWPKIVASLDELVGSKNAEAKPRSEPAPRPAASKEPLLAVLPFDNLSSDEELAFFCDGVSEEIQRSVSEASRLKVVARTSSFQFRGAQKETGKVASALGATHLLDGSVRRGGSRVRISAELVECSTQRVLWGDRFDGDLDDVFELQDSIASEVAHALKVALLPSRTEQSLPAELYEKFLRARGRITAGDALFDDSAERAFPLLLEVTEAAPDYAPAWELLASSGAASLRSGHFEGDYEERRAIVEDAAAKALALDHNRGEAYLAQALLEPWGAYREREKLLTKAITVSPNDPSALTEMSHFYWTVGRFKEALEMALKASELNPLMPAARLHVAQMHTYVGSYETSMQMHRELHRRWPDNAGIMISLMGFSASLGFWDLHDETLQDVDRFEGWTARDLRATIAFAEAARTKDPELVERRVERYVGLLDKIGSVPLNLIQSLADLKGGEFALDVALKSDYSFVFHPQGARPGGYYPGVLLGPWSEVAKLPRFAELCAQLGLADYWIATGRWPDTAGWVPYDFKREMRSARDAQKAQPA